jgi:hypothetical protein
MAVHDPQDAVEHRPGIGQWSTTQFGARTQFREQRCDALPFFVIDITVKIHDFSFVGTMTKDIQSPSRGE